MLALLGVCGGLLLCELLSRAALDWFPSSPLKPATILGVPYEHVPGFRWSGGRFEYRINARGIRGDEDFPAAKPEGERRVLVLGDSIAFGWGIPVEKTAPSLIEMGLRRREGGRSRERVINSGTTSYNAWSYYFYLQGRGWDFQPDRVVLFLCLNDSDSGSLSLPAVTPGETLPLRFRLKYLVLKSRLAYMILFRFHLRDPLVRAWRRFFPVSAVIPEDAGSQEILSRLDPQSLAAVRRDAPILGWDLQAMKDAFRAMMVEQDWQAALGMVEAAHQVCLARGVPFQVVVFPVAIQVVPGYVDSRPQSFLVAALRAKGISTIDLLPVYRAAVKRGGWPYLGGGDMLHPNALGHRLAADEVLLRLQP